MMSRANTTGNRILDCLPENEVRVLLATAELVAMSQGDDVFEQDGGISHVYFPTMAALGVVIFMHQEAKQVEGGPIGNEGMVGLPLFLGLPIHPFGVTAQVSGEALKVTATSFLEAAQAGSALDRLLRRYTLYRLRSANQLGACNTLHSVEERMCRWLLMAHDRAGATDFFLTHEFFGELLGVRRQTVSLVAGMLQRAGIITYRRGNLRIVDREGLEAASCECYEAINQLYARIVDTP